MQKSDLNISQPIFKTFETWHFMHYHNAACVIQRWDDTHTNTGYDINSLVGWLVCLFVLLAFVTRTQMRLGQKSHWYTKTFTQQRKKNLFQ